jgi:hypothetical protein
MDFAKNDALGNRPFAEGVSAGTIATRGPGDVVFSQQRGEKAASEGG